MASRKKEGPQLTILEAVETLTDIAEMDFDREVDVASDQELHDQNKMVSSRTIKWDEREDSESSARVIKETFNVVLNYLRNFYQHDIKNFEKPKVVEGVKTIMVLVGEAANKLDKYTTIFANSKTHSCHELKEFKDLQDFYLTRVARKVDEGVLGKWILELTKGVMEYRRPLSRLEGKEGFTTKYEFIDLEAVKKDEDYELLLLRKEDGSRFYNPRLIRNIKLVCDFGEKIGSRKKSEDILEDIPIWHDYAIHIVAKNIVQGQGYLLDKFFHETKDSVKRSLVADVNKTIIALLMASNPRNLLRNSPVKSCSEYFDDYQRHLRHTLNSPEYKRFLAYIPKRGAKTASILVDTLHSLCQGFISGVHGYYDLIPVFESTLNKAINAQSSEHAEAAKNSELLWNQLASDNAAFKKMIRQHPNGALEKDIDLLEHRLCHSFDPLIQSNLPSQLFWLYVGDNKMTNIRIPTPTHQEFIHKAKVVDEFKGFLRNYAAPRQKKKHLLINLQDRTSWREHARCVALEDLQECKEFSQSLTVVSLNKDTEFYNQETPYQQDRHANIFIQHFKENLEDEGCGFLFPQHIKNQLFDEFVDGVLNEIHKTFFSGMNVLTIDHRHEFIEIFYIMLTLKLLELESPDTFSLTCKDGLDIGCAASTQLYAFMKILSHEKMTDTDVTHMNIMLYAPTLLIRERLVQQNRFERMLNTLKRVESTKQEMGVKKFHKCLKDRFGKYYETKILTDGFVEPAG